MNQRAMHQQAMNEHAMNQHAMNEQVMNEHVMTGHAMNDQHAALRAQVDQLINDCIARFQDIPGIHQQLHADAINLPYYKRNLIEIILRLRMKRTIDALTIHYFTKRAPRLAKRWSEYTADEMLHDELFAADLAQVGVTRDAIYSTTPMLATKLLQGYFYYGLEHEGIPLASLCSSYLIEYASLKTQPALIDNVERLLGAQCVKGQRAHLAHDDHDNHTDFVWDVLVQTACLPHDAARILDHVRHVYQLFEMYYRELYAATLPESTQTMP